MVQEFRSKLLTEFAGRPVNEFDPERTENLELAALPGEVEASAWRVARRSSCGSYRATFELFLATVDATRIRALIIGEWEDDRDQGRVSSTALGPLLDYADRFPALEALFLGDLHARQSEVSWIRQVDPGRLFEAFPGLREFGLRGTSYLTMEPFKHATLEELTFQGGGLPSSVAQAIAASELPALTHLDLYLGNPNYGGDSTPADYEPILSGRAFPALRHLGLRDADNQDEIAAAIAHAPVVAQLETLDLSLGNLSDEGATALLTGQPLTHLKSLDLHHHYLSDEMMQRLREALPGVEVNLGEQCEPEEWGDEDEEDYEVFRYIAVSE